MKIHSLIYSAIALLFAAVFFIGMLSMAFLILPKTPEEQRGIFHLVIALEAVVVPLLAVGATINIAKGRPVAWATALIMAGYTLIIWLIPLAIWGAFLLYANRRRNSSPA